MEIKTIISREMDQNCYLIEREGKGILIDPGMDYEKIICETDGVEVNYILLTHCHFDHLFCLNEIRKGKIVAGGKECSRNMISPVISLCDRECLPEAPLDMEINEGEYNFDGINVKVIKTPGHTDCSVCYLIENNLFSGDTLFAGSIGRTDFPTGDFDILEKSVREKIYTLDDETAIYPGHGQKTKVGYEKKNNPFIRE